MRKVKLTKQGNSTGITIPSDILESLKLKRGDEVKLTLVDDSLKVTRDDGAYQKTMDAGRRVAARYRRTLRDLAK
jgi:putative addiction module antidote